MIQDILDSLLTHKLRQLSDIKRNRDLIGFMGWETFAKECSTIQLNMGRQSGHTTAIIRNSARCDLVVTHNRLHADMMHRDHGVSALSAGSNFDTFFRGRLTYYRYVWVDDASHIGYGRIDSIIHSMATSRRSYGGNNVNPPVFILLG